MHFRKLRFPNVAGALAILVGGVLLVSYLERASLAVAPPGVPVYLVLSFPGIVAACVLAIASWMFFSGSPTAGERSHRLHLLNVAGGAACFLAGVVLVAYLGDWLLVAPVGAFVYLVMAPPVATSASILGVPLWTLGRSAPPFFAGSPATRFFCVLTIVLSSLASTIAIPAAWAEAVYRLYRSDPIGAGDDVGRGPCTTRTVADVLDRSGLVASVRETSCSGTWDGDLMYFVFVHAPGVPDSRENLVYWYAAEMGLDDAAPAVRWLAPAKLRIAVSRAVVLETTLQKWKVGSAAIGYEF